MEQSIIQQVHQVAVFDILDFIKDWAGVLTALLVPAIGVIIRQHYSLKRLNNIIDDEFAEKWSLVRERLKIAREDIKLLKDDSNG